MIFTALFAAVLVYPLARLLCDRKRLGWRRPGTTLEDLKRRRGAGLYLVVPQQRRAH